MIAQNGSYEWNVINADGLRLAVVTAPDEAAAITEARKALARPGRELSHMAWVSGGRKVERR